MMTNLKNKLFGLLLVLPIAVFAQSYAVDCVVLSISNRILPRPNPNDIYVGSYFGNVPSSIAFASVFGSQQEYVPIIEQSIVIQTLENNREKYLATQTTTQENLMYVNQRCFFARDAHGTKIIPR